MLVLQPPRIDDGLLDAATIALASLRFAQPVLVLSASFVLLFWKLIIKYGKFMSAGVSLEDEEEDETGQLGAAKKKKKTKKQKEEEAKPVFRPRRLVLLAAFVLASFSFMIDAAALVIYSVLFRRGVMDDLDLWSILLSIIGYWLPGFLLITTTKDPLATKSDYYTGIMIASIICQPCALASLATVLAIYKHVGALAIVSLVTYSVRTLLFIALATAYLQRFKEEIPKEELEAKEEVVPDAANGEVGAENGDASSTKKDGEEEEDEDDEDEEDAKEAEKLERKAKARSYDIVTIYKRIRRLLPYIAPLQSRMVRFIVVLCVILVLSSSALAILIPRQTGIIVSHLSEGTPPWTAILIWGALRFSVGYSGFLSSIRSILWVPIDQRAAREMEVVSFQHVLGLSARYHNNKKTGELLNVLNRAGSASDFLEFAIFNMAPLMLDLSSATIYLTVVYGWTITFIVVCTRILYALLTLYSMTGVRALRTAINERSDLVSANKNDAVSNVEIIHYFSAEAYEVNRFKTGTLKTQLTSYSLTAFYRLTGLAQGIVTDGGVLLGALYVARQITTGHKSTGDFVAYVAYMSQLLSRISQLVWYQDYFSRLMVSTDKLMDILDEESEIVDKDDAVELYECKGDIEFDNVTFMYEDPKLLHAKYLRNKDAQAASDTTTSESAVTVANGDAANAAGEASADDDKKKKKKKGPRKAVQNISFKVKPGQHVALVGETGSGKSTIFKLLFRFFDVTEGSIKVDGRDVRDYTQHSLRQALGVVQQEGSLFNASILDNIRYGNIAASDSEVMEAAKIAKIHDRVVQWPKKYHTIVGERGVKLSGGEKQRVNIARTLLKKPDVLLLDEATSALDTNTEKEIQAQLRELTQGKTTLAIAHRLSTISHSDQIIVLKEGKIQEVGTHNELLAIEDGHYKKLWTAQITAEKKKEDEKDEKKDKDGTAAKADGEKNAEGVLVDVSVPEAGSSTAEATATTTVQAEASTTTAATESGEASASNQSKEDKDKKKDK